MAHTMKLITLSDEMMTGPNFNMESLIQTGRTRPGPGQKRTTIPLKNSPSAIVDMMAAISGWPVRGFSTSRCSAYASAAIAASSKMKAAYSGNPQPTTICQTKNVHRPTRDPCAKLKMDDDL